MTFFSQILLLQYKAAVMPHSDLKAHTQPMSRFIAMAINLKSHSVKFSSFKILASWDLKHTL